MKYISIQDAYEIIWGANAVEVEGNIVEVAMAELDENNDNEFLYLGWTCDGKDYNLKFRVGENRLVRVDSTVMFLTDNEGDNIKITFLVPKELEK